MKIKSNVWMRVFNECVSNSDSVSDAFEHFKRCMRDIYPNAREIELQAISKQQYCEFVKWFNSLLSDYSGYEDYWTEEDYKWCHILSPSLPTKFNNLEIPKKLISMFDVKMSLKVTSSKLKATQKTKDDVLAGIAWDKSFEFDDRNPKIQPSADHKWRYQLDPVTGSGYYGWGYSP